MDIISKRLNIHDSSTIKKCEEFLRVLQTKTSLKLSDQVKTIICLEIATTFTGSSFDKEAALQLCALKKSSYENNLNNIKKILNIDKPLSISELCVQFSCTQLKDAAQELYSHYKDSDSKDDMHPQYAAAAVYTVCKMNNMKPPKSQFVTLSRLKSNQWNALINDFETFAITNLKQTKFKQKSNVIENTVEGHVQENANVKEKSDDHVTIEDYEVWKNRILREAEQAIREGKQ
ncbi:hypothetical protein HHI36_001822 [Cryptolaemus montrouzieri]|uniref:Origin recognition complex subunit 6 n=1 Tax=Cryptolaemus montrouzieri TaxID=559131 RepID=A0ABD2P9F2_9CUCU